MAEIKKTTQGILKFFLFLGILELIFTLTDSHIIPYAFGSFRKDLILISIAIICVIIGLWKLDFLFSKLKFLGEEK